ncbi:unnamed protein product [Diamesa serratosioi]
MKNCYVIIMLCVMKYSSASQWNITLNTLEISDEPDARGSKIVNGLATTSYNQFPYQCLIFITRSTVTVQCGGSLISDTWLITARHCVKNAISIELRIGDNSRNNYAVKMYAVGFAKSDLADVALIQVGNKIKFTSFVNFVRLPTLTQASTKFVDYIATVSGYGITNTKTGALPDYLQFTTLKIITNEDCAKVYGTVDALVLCAVGYPNPKSSSCPGDSGSPLVVYESGIPTLVGVVSYGALNGKYLIIIKCKVYISSLLFVSGCDLGYPVGYYRVASQLQWISAYTGIAIRS